MPRAPSKAQLSFIGAEAAEGYSANAGAGGGCDASGGALLGGQVVQSQPSADASPNGPSSPPSAKKQTRPRSSAARARQGGPAKPKVSPIKDPPPVATPSKRPEKKAPSNRPSLLFRLKPTNLEEAWEAFAASGFADAPRFTYTHSEESVTKYFEENSHVCFELLPEAKRILQRVQDEYGGPEAFMQVVYGERKITAEELRVILAEYLKDHNIEDKVEIRVVDNMLSAANVIKAGAENYVVNIANSPISWNLVPGICDHEVGTHLLRMMNDQLQVWHGIRDRYKLANPWTTEEGFATLNTYQSMPCMLMYPQALRYYAVCRGAHAGFVELFHELRTHVSDAKRCWQMCCRIKRGMIDTSLPGAFYMDQAYFKGAVEILRHLDEVDFGRLYGGQIALQDLDKVHFLLRKECVRLPRFLNSFDTLKAYKVHCRKLIEENQIDATIEKVCKPVYIRIARDFFKPTKQKPQLSAAAAFGVSEANSKDTRSASVGVTRAERRSASRPWRTARTTEVDGSTSTIQQSCDLDRTRGSPSPPRRRPTRGSLSPPRRRAKSEALVEKRCDSLGARPGWAPAEDVADVASGSGEQPLHGSICSSEQSRTPVARAARPSSRPRRRASQSSSSCLQAGADETEASIDAEASATLSETREALLQEEALPESIGELQGPKRRTVKKKNNACRGSFKEPEADIDAERKCSEAQIPSLKAKPKSKAKCKAKGRTKGKTPLPSTGMVTSAAALESSELAESSRAIDANGTALDLAHVRLDAMLSSFPQASESEVSPAIATSSGTHHLHDEEKQVDEDLVALASYRLRLATECPDEDTLRVAIEEAQQIGVPMPEIARARKALEIATHKQMARELIEAAQDAGDADKLRFALAEARKLELPAEEMAPAEQLLRDIQTQDTVAAALSAAVESRDVAQLRFSIQQAKSASVDWAHIHAARLVLKEERTKEKACGSIPLSMETCVAPATASEESVSPTRRSFKTKRRWRKIKPEDHAEEKEAEKAAALARVKMLMSNLPEADMQSFEAVSNSGKQLSNAITAARAVGVAEDDLIESERCRIKLLNDLEDFEGSIRVAD